MDRTRFDVVTGAFGYTGKYITRRLLAEGRRVRTLTGHPDRPHPFGPAVRAAPFNFDRPAALVASLAGADTLYNTYWVRFRRGSTTFDQAVENTRTLVRAAEQAGVRRIVHISITNPSVASPLPYFRGKALLEEFIAASSLSHAIVRPTVIFGDEDILINNIAWLLRVFPVFVVPGDGRYQLQPVFVDDLARLAVDAGRPGENVVIDAAGPEVFTFEDLARLIGNAIGSPARIMRAPAWVTLSVARAVGCVTGDVVLTREEVDGLMAGLLVSDRSPTGTTRLSDWLNRNADRVGRKYASELTRHYRPGTPQ